MRDAVEAQLEEENPEAVLLEGFDDALIGIARRNGLSVAAYSEEKCLEVLMAQGMEREGAIDYFENNVAGSWMGDGTPIIVGVPVC